MIPSAELYEEIIETLANETGKHIDIIINEVARHYEVKETDVKAALKSISSKFVDGTNRIVGYIDGEPIKRTTYHMSCIRIYKKIISGLNHINTFNPEDQTHINFITEATYNYLKENAPCRPDGTAVHFDIPKSTSLIPMDQSAELKSASI
jgi:hypothetical protein